jgi:non-ribosomal peptide synthase protein (TIGR01720 family)
VDSVSWRILLDDFLTAYQQALSGKEISLPPKTTSYRAWAQRLLEMARSDEVWTEMRAWLSTSLEVSPLPVDLAGGENLEGSSSQVVVKLPVDETAALLQEVPSAYGADANTALLGALAEAIASWTGKRCLWVELEGHGREDLFEGVDISRTVGWFTTLFPARFDLEKAITPPQILLAVKEQLYKIPRKGIGYGLLRYLSGNRPNPREDGLGEAASPLAGQPYPEISFNYLGQFDSAQAEGFRPASESPGPSRSLQGSRICKLSVTAILLDGQLQVEWNYSETLHRRETIERLAENFMRALESMIEHCRAPGTVGYTPSDFPDLELSQDEIEDLMEEIGEGS